MKLYGGPDGGGEGGADRGAPWRSGSGAAWPAAAGGGGAPGATGGGSSRGAPFGAHGSAGGGTKGRVGDPHGHGTGGILGGAGGIGGGATGGLKAWKGDVEITERIYWGCVVGNPKAVVEMQRQRFGVRICYHALKSRGGNHSANDSAFETQRRSPEDCLKATPRDLSRSRAWPHHTSFPSAHAMVVTTIA